MSVDSVENIRNMFYWNMNFTTKEMRNMWDRLIAVQWNYIGQKIPFTDVPDILGTLYEDAKTLWKDYQGPIH